MGKLFILILVAILQDIAATDWCAKYYEHSDYNGWEKVVGETSQLNLINENDQTSSVKVRPGCTLKLFEHINKEGLLVTLKTDVSALSHNDKVSSLSCTCQPDWCAKYYEHSDYNGWEKVAGETSQLNLINENDQTSSVKVQPGCTLKLFEHINKVGLLVTLTTDVSALSHNDKVSSLSCTCLPDESLKNLFGCTANEICKMSMKSEQGKYVTAMGYHDKYEANANSPTIGSDQIWEVIFKGDGKVSLKGAHGRYMRWYGNRQNRQVKADAEKPNPWETFIVEDMGNGKLAFFQTNGRSKKKYYLVAGSDGSLTNQDAAEAGTKFEIIPAATN